MPTLFMTNMSYDLTSRFKWLNSFYDFIPQVYIQRYVCQSATKTKYTNTYTDDPSWKKGKMPQTKYKTNTQQMQAGKREKCHKPNTQIERQKIQAWKRGKMPETIYKTNTQKTQAWKRGEMPQTKYTENPGMRKRGNAKRNTCDGLGCVPPVSFSRHSLQNWL